MSTPRERLNSIRQKLMSRQESSQGRVPLSGVERLVKGVGEGFTAPLDVVNLATEPEYGPTGPGVAGTVGQVAGSVAPYLLGELALARVLPFLRGAGAAPSMLRSAISQGIIDFGRKPETGDTRVEGAVRGAVTGALMGALLAPKVDPVTGKVLEQVSIPRAGLAGAVGTVAPIAMGQAPRSPVEVTGSPALDALIFNTALGGAMHGAGRTMSAEAPPVEASSMPPPVPQPVPSAAGPFTPPPIPRTRRTAPVAPHQVDPASPAVEEVVSRVSPIKPPPFPMPKAWKEEQLPLPGVEPVLSNAPFEMDSPTLALIKAGKRTAVPVAESRVVPSATGTGLTIGKLADDSPVTLYRVVDREELAAILKSKEVRSGATFSDAHEQARFELPVRTSFATDAEGVGSVTGEAKALIEVDGRGLSFATPLATTEGKTFGDYENGLQITEPIPARRITKVHLLRTPSGEYTEAARLLRRLHASSADEFKVARVQEQKQAVSVPDSQLVTIVRSEAEHQALQAQADLIRNTAVVNKGRVLELDPDTVEWFRSSENPPKGFDPETGTISTQGLSGDELESIADLAADLGDQELVQTVLRTKAGLMGKGKKHGVVKPHAPMKRLKEVVSSKMAERAAVDQTLEEAVDDLEDLTIDEGISTMVDADDTGGARIRGPVGKQFVRDIAQVQQASSGDVTSFSGMIKAMKEMRTPIIGTEGDRFKIAMPDETTQVLTKDEVIARIQAALPPTDAVPLTVQPGEPPVHVPIADMSLYQQLNLPKVKRVKQPPIPEPSQRVVLKDAEREAGVAERRIGPRRLTEADVRAGVQEERRVVARREIESEVDRVIRAGQRVAEMAAEVGPPPIPKERGIARVSQRLPKKHQAAHVKREAEAKGIEVTESPGGILLTDTITGKTTRAKTWNEAAKKVAKNTNNEGPMRSDEELRSIFRRRFAGAKSKAERNKIRKKYALYQAYFPQEGEALRSGEAPMQSLDGVINARIPPTPDLTPPEAGGGGRFTLPPGQSPPAIPGGGPTITDTHTLDDVHGMGWTRYFEPMKQWSLRLEQRSKGTIPAYSQIFQPLDKARQEFQVFLSGYYPDLVKLWKPYSRDRGARERIGRYLEAEDKLKAIGEIGISAKEIQAAEGLKKLWDKLYKDFGITAPYIDNYLPWRRMNLGFNEAQALEQFYKNRPIPRSYTVTHELERETNGMFAREMDAFKLFHEYLYRGARKHFVAPHHARAVSDINALRLPRDLEWARNELTHFVDRMWGTTDQSTKRLNDFYQSVLDKLGVKSDPHFRTDLVSLLLQLNVGAHMAWRAPLAIRNGFQIFFVYPMVGERAFARGLQKALTKEGKAEAMKLNVIGPDQVPFGDEIFNPFGLMSRINRAGLKAYAKIDDITRVVAYHSAKEKVLESAIKYQRENWRIDKFIEDAELNSMFHPVEVQAISKMVQAGDIPGAAQKAGVLMQENTNFIYRAGNSPGAFRGVAGRLFGQFGTWPASYIEYARYLATYGTPAERAGKIARFLAFNTAFGTAGTMLGINTWKWLMFGPLVFTGGPLMQMSMDAGKVASSFTQGRLDEDPEAKMALRRLKNQIPASFIPGSSALRDVEQTIEAGNRSAGAALTRALLGQTPEGPLPSLTPRSRRRAIAEEVRRRRQGGQ